MNDTPPHPANPIPPSNMQYNPVKPLNLIPTKDIQFRTGEIFPNRQGEYLLPNSLWSILMLRPTPDSAKAPMY